MDTECRKADFSRRPSLPAMHCNPGIRLPCTQGAAPPLEAAPSCRHLRVAKARYCCGTPDKPVLPLPFFQPTSGSARTGIRKSPLTWHNNRNMCHRRQTAPHLLTPEKKLCSPRSRALLSSIFPFSNVLFLSPSPTYPFTVSGDIHCDSCIISSALRFLSILCPSTPGSSCTLKSVPVSASHNAFPSGNLRICPRTVCQTE